MHLSVLQIAGTRANIHTFLEKSTEENKKAAHGNRAAAREVNVLYTDFGYIGKDGIEYATIDEAIEAGVA